MSTRGLSAFGKWTLLFGYFVTGFRHLVAIVAGTVKLRVRNLLYSRMREH